jgi:hypothetical protein
METLQNEDFARVIVAIIVAMPFDVSFGQTQPDQKAPEIPSDLLATLRHDLKGVEWYEDCMDTFPDQPHPWLLFGPSTSVDLDRRRMF